MCVVPRRGCHFLEKAEMGAGQIVYGTDMPYPWPAGVDFILNAKFLSDAEKAAMLGGTLVKLLRIASASSASV